MTSFFASFFPTLAAWFISLIGRKAAVFLVSITAYVAATSAFLVLINSLVQSILDFQSVPQWVSSSVGMFMPYSFTFNLSVLIGAYASRWAYDIITSKISLINSAT